jgi:protease-4
MEGTIGVGIRAADWVPVLDGLRRRRRVRAVVIDVDSRGGSASASDYLHEAVHRLAATKPVISFCGGLCASGGYLIACAARQLVVQPAALVGSIGVISVRPLAPELMQRVGVSVEVAKSHRLKDMGAFWREPTEEERAREQALVDEFYAMFLERVGATRGLTDQRLRELATGEVFTGRQAVGNGLADRLGTFEDAVALAAELGGVRRRVRWFGPRRSLRARLLGPLGAEMTEAAAERLLALGSRQPLYLG